LECSRSSKEFVIRGIDRVLDAVRHGLCAVFDPAKEAAAGNRIEFFDRKLAVRVQDGVAIPRSS
jgi:hypothetical protein